MAKSYPYFIVLALMLIIYLLGYNKLPSEAYTNAVDRYFQELSSFPAVDRSRLTGVNCELFDKSSIHILVCSFSAMQPSTSGMENIPGWIKLSTNQDVDPWRRKSIMHSYQRDRTIVRLYESPGIGLTSGSVQHL